MKPVKISSSECPCGSGGAYVQCCEPFHKGEKQAPSAEILMRSRYCAYVLNLYDYIRQTWHPSTYPVDLVAPDVSINWLGLTIKKAWANQDDEAFVEFVARSRLGSGPADRLHEISRFLKEDGRWFYVDGEFLK